MADRVSNAPVIAARLMQPIKRGAPLTTISGESSAWERRAIEALHKIDSLAAETGERRVFFRLLRACSCRPAPMMFLLWRIDAALQFRRRVALWQQPR